MSGGVRPRRPIRVALANDYEVVVRGLTDMLAAYPDRLTVVELDMQVPNRSPVDLTLYDTFSMPQADGARIPELTADPVAGRVVVYTWNMHRELVDRAFAWGVRGYIGKSLGGPELVAALERVHAGERLVVPDPAQARVDGPGGEWPGRRHGLSAREAEVVALITQGLSNQQIAERAHLSINSVKTYVRGAYAKMGVARRAQAVLWGLEHGMGPDHGRVVLTDGRRDGARQA